MFTTKIEKNVVSVVREGATAQLFVSGPTVLGHVKFLGYIATEMGAQDTDETMAQWASTVLTPRAFLTDGVSNPDFLGLGKARLEDVVTAHLEIHRKNQNHGTGVGMKYRETAFDYRLVRSFGYRNTTALLSASAGVPPTTIKRRVSEAKDNGVLEKAYSLEHMPHLFIKRA